MKNLYERSLEDSNTGHIKKSHGWIILALAVTLGIIFVILCVLNGILFGHYSAMNNELSVLKYNVSDPVKKNDVSELWKSVSNIMGDLSKLKDKVDITEGSCKTCPPGWTLIKSHCYYFSLSIQNWERSKELCVERNGILIVIKNDNEMISLLPFIKQFRYWIGLRRDPGDLNTWVWTDGSPVTYSAWNVGEPNNDGDSEHCAEIVGATKLWNDLRCFNKGNFICKGVWSC